MATLCPYCHAEVPASEAMACPGCGVAHHHECWIENDGCAVQLCLHGPKLPYLRGPAPSQPGESEPQRPRARLTVDLEPDAGPLSRDQLSPAASRPEGTPRGRRWQLVIAAAVGGVVALAVILLVTGGSADPLTVSRTTSSGDDLPDADRTAAIIRQQRARVEQSSRETAEAQLSFALPVQPAPPPPASSDQGSVTPPAQPAVPVQPVAPPPQLQPVRPPAGPPCLSPDQAGCS